MTGDTFGKTTIGAGDIGNSINVIIACKYSLTVTGVITKITCYCKYIASADNMKAAVYSDDAGAMKNLQGNSGNVSVGTSYSWVDFTLTSPITRSPANYWLAIMHKGAAANTALFKSDAGATNQYLWETQTYDSFPDPFTGGNYLALALSIYATYTPVVVEEKPLICKPLVSPLIVSMPVIRSFKDRFPKFMPRVVT